MSDICIFCRSQKMIPLLPIGLHPGQRAEAESCEERPEQEGRLAVVGGVHESDREREEREEAKRGEGLGLGVLLDAGELHESRHGEDGKPTDAGGEGDAAEDGRDDGEGGRGPLKRLELAQEDQCDDVVDDSRGDDELADDGGNGFCCNESTFAAFAVIGAGAGAGVIDVEASIDEGG